MSIPKHKVFISYYHNDDQHYKNHLLYLNHLYDIFDDYSVHEDDIDDTNLTSEQIRRIIRDDYIRDASVLILLCGENTKTRKHIDWEIHAAMYDSPINHKMGILVINLPSIYGKQSTRAASNEEKKYIADETARWYSIHTIDEYNQDYPYMPDRIIDSFIKGSEISVVDWERIERNPNILKYLIDCAFVRRKYVNYDDSRHLRRKNSTKVSV
ncbi:MAG: TIR domain-containing protein [Erysipelotrichales bacterium]|nr:TIR domain-containing protein [Erysipelotrichales bacterium]